MLLNYHTHILIRFPHLLLKSQLISNIKKQDSEAVTLNKAGLSVLIKNPSLWNHYHEDMLSNAFL